MDQLLGLDMQQIFSAGDAPAHWQHQVVDKMGWLDGLQRDSDWVDTGFLQQSPDLLTGPLFGTLLAELTQSIVPTTVPESEASVPRRTSSKQPPKLWGKSRPNPAPRPNAARKPSTNNNKSAGMAMTSARTQHQGPVPEQLPAEIDRTLLHHLAGNSTEARVPNVSKHPRFNKQNVRSDSVSAPPMLNERQNVRSDSVSAPPALNERQAVRSDSVSAPPTLNEQQAMPTLYLQSVARRVKMSIHKYGRSSSLTLPIREKVPRQSSPDDNWLLTSQGSLPLNGPTVSVKLLAHLLTLSGGRRGDRLPSGIKSGESAGLAQSSGHPQPGAPIPVPTAGGTKPTFSQPAKGSALPTRELTANNPDALVRGEDRPGSIRGPHPGQPLNVNDRQSLHPAPPDRPEHISPPQGAPMLPILDPTSDVIEPPAVSPLTAVFNRRETRAATEITNSDDLPSLSAKIKRILDEEARRYGIDV